MIRKKHKENHLDHFVIITDWVDAHKIRAAKAILEIYGERYNIDSITIKTTLKQYEEDVNAFKSGLTRKEIKK
jgi:hypothetical protein